MFKGPAARSVGHQFGSLLVRVPGLAKHREENAFVQGAIDPDFTRGRVGFNAGLRVDAQQRLGDGFGAAAAGHVWNVETKHLDLLVV